MGNGKWDTAQRTRPSPARAQLTEGRNKASATGAPKTGTRAPPSPEENRSRAARIRNRRRRPIAALAGVAIWPPNSSPLRPSAPCYSGHALPSSPTLRFTHNTICSTTFSPLHATFILVKMTSERVSACELFRLSEKAPPTDESRSQLMLLLVLAAAANNKLLLLAAPYCCLLLVLTLTTIRSR